MIYINYRLISLFPIILERSLKNSYKAYKETLSFCQYQQSDILITMWFLRKILNYPCFD